MPIGIVMDSQISRTDTESYDSVRNTRKKRRILWCSGNTVYSYLGGGRFEFQPVFPIIWVKVFSDFSATPKTSGYFLNETTAASLLSLRNSPLPSTLYIPRYWRHYKIYKRNRCSAVTVPTPVRRRRPVWRVRQSSHHCSCPRTGYADQVVIVSNHVLFELALVFIYCIHKYRLSLQTC
jgi:hypothetical protein